MNLTGGTFKNIAGSLRETKLTEVLMARRERHGFPRKWRTIFYDAPDRTERVDRKLFTTIEAGRAINNSMTRLENGLISVGANSNISPSVVLTQLDNQSARVNLGDIQGRTNLFQTNPDITSGFLVETDSKFINLDDFFSSNYFLDQILEEGITDPDTFHRRRYGDAYVEDRIVRDQFFKLTGRRTLDEYLDPQDQMRALYDSALDVSKELNLTFGVSLTKDQVNNLTKDIIWLETQTINGHEVLVPKVYLSQVTLDNLDSRGANIIASEVNLSSGILLNTGSIQGRNKLNIDTGALYNLGGRIAGGDVKIKADEILNRRLTESIENNQDQDMQVYDFFTKQKKTVRAVKNRSSYTRIGNESVIESTGNMNVETTGDINNVGGDIRAGGDLNIKAGGEVTSVSITDQSSWDYKQGDYEDKISRVTHIKSGISAGGDLNLAGKKINLIGTDLEAGEDMTLAAEEGVTIESVQDQYNRSLKKKEKGGVFSGSKRTTHEEYKLTTNESVFQAGGKLKIVTDKDDITLQAVNPDADSYELIVRDDEGEINLKSNKDVDFKQVKTEQSGALMFKNVDKGHHKEVVKGVIFNTKEETEIILQARNVNIDILEHGSAEQGITEIAEKMPELAWLKNLKNDPNVNWSEIEAIHDEWNDTTQGLSQVGMLLVTIAVAIAAGPAAGALGTMVSGTAVTATAFTSAMGAMATAGFSSLVSQATVSLINNQGNLGSVLKELTSSASLRGLAVSMATAGTMQGIGDAANWSDQVQNADKLSLGQRASNGAIRAGTGAVVRAGAGSLFNKESFSDSLEANLESAGVAFAGEMIANQIGSEYNQAAKDGITAGEYIAHKVAHGALGCAMGTASGGECAGGAIGSISGEIFAEALVNRQAENRVKELYPDNKDNIGFIRREANNFVMERKTLTTNLAAAVGVVTAVAFGEDAISAKIAAENSVENNLFFIPLVLSTETIIAVGTAVMAGLAASSSVDQDKVMQEMKNETDTFLDQRGSSGNGGGNEPPEDPDKDKISKKNEWSKTFNKTSEENAQKHWKDHGKEFSEFSNKREYVEGASNFMKNPPNGTLSKQRSNGDIIRYNPQTNTFGVMDKGGNVRTMFKPKRGLDYFKDQ